MIIILGFTKFHPHTLRDTSHRITDEQIVDLICSKDQQGLSLLYERYGFYLFGIVVKIVKRDDIAEIILQDTFLKAWRKMDTYDGAKSKLITWLVRIAKNCAIDMTRSKTFKQTIKLVELANIPTSSEPQVKNINIDTIDLKDFVNKMDVKFREIFDLIYFKGHTTKEVAELLKIPQGTVKSRVRKGLKDLKSIVER